MRWLLISIAFLCLTAPAIARPNRLADSARNPSQPLLEVLNMFHINHTGTWESIQKETEEAWLSHGRNVDIQDIKPVAVRNLQKTYDLFTALDMTQAIYPDQSCFNYAAIHGSWASIVRDRFWFLKTLWEKGVRFSTLVFWTGDRPLDPKMESEKILLDPHSSPYPFRSNWKWRGPLPKNETEMVFLIFDQLDLPQEWRRMPIMIADAGKPDGFKRPHTEHTFQAWLALRPYPGCIIAVSDQPFICRQNEVLLPLLPPCFGLETVGPGFTFERFKEEKRATAILLAELAYRIKLFCQPLPNKNGCKCLSSASWL